MQKDAREVSPLLTDSFQPLVLASLFGLLVTASACDLLTNPEDRGGFAGTIVDVSPTLGTSAPWDSALVTKIHVRRGGEECGLIYSIYPTTELFVRVSGRIRQVGPERLIPGVDVRVWQSGVTLLSCPGQAGANRVKIE